MRTEPIASAPMLREPRADLLPGEVRIRLAEARNYGPFECLRFELPDSGMVLIGGLNGTGKTWAQNLAPYTFFGETVEDHSADEVVRWDPTDPEGDPLFPSLSAIELVTAQNVWRIERYRGDKVYRNDVRILCDGNETGRLRASHCGRDIARIIGFSGIDEWRHRMFPQRLSYVSPARFFALRNADAVEVLEKALGIGDFAEAQEEAAASAKAAKAALDAARSAVSAHGTALAGARQTFATARQAAQSAQRQHADAVAAWQRRVADAETRLRETEASRPDAGETPEALQAQYNQHNAVIATRLQQAEASLQAWRQRHHVATLQIREANARLAALATRIGDIAALVESGRCPCCEQPVSHDHGAAVMAGEEAKAQPIAADLARAEAEAEAAAQNVAAVQAEVQKQAAAVKQLADLYRVRSVEAATRARDVAAWQSRLAQAQRELADLRANAPAAPTDGTAVMHHAAAQVVATRVALELAAAEAAVAELTISEDGFMAQHLGVRAFRHFALSSRLPDLESAANHHLALLSGGEIETRIRSTDLNDDGSVRDELSRKVLLRGRVVPYKTLSGGQARRLDLAVCFGLGDLGARRSGIRFLGRFLDEPLHGLDEPGVESLMTSLREFVETRRELVVMTSDRKLSHTIFDAVYEVRSNGDASTLERVR